MDGGNKYIAVFAVLLLIFPASAASDGLTQEDEPPDRHPSGYVLQDTSYFAILAVLMIVPVGISIYAYGKSQPHPLGAIAVSMTFAILSPGIWSEVGQVRTPVIVPLAVGVSGLSHLYVLEEPREKVKTGSVYIAVLLAIPLAHNLSLAV